MGWFSKKSGQTWSQMIQGSPGWSMERKGFRTFVNTPQGRFELPMLWGQRGTVETPGMIVMKGLLAGLAGTAAVTLAMQGLSAMMGPEQADRQEAEFGPPRHESPRQAPTETFVERGAATVGQQPLTQESKETLATATHWAYGSLWGAIYGLAHTTLRLPEPVGGALFGMTVWGVGPLSLFPAMKLTPPPSQQSGRTLATNGGLHLLYGWVTAWTFRFLSKDSKFM